MDARLPSATSTTRPASSDTPRDHNPGLAARTAPVSQIAKGGHLHALDGRRCDRPRRLPPVAAIAAVAGVLAAGVIRDDLQAHLALARVGEQPPSSTPTSLPVRTSWGTRPSCRSASPRNACRSPARERRTPPPPTPRGVRSYMRMPSETTASVASPTDETGQCETGLLQMGTAEDSRLKGVCLPVRS